MVETKGREIEREGEIERERMHTYSDKQVLRGAVGVHKTGCCNGQTNIKILNNVFYDPCVFLLQKKKQ